jgi:acyl-CoA thioesterase FadM
MTMFVRLLILVIKRLFWFKKTDLLQPCYTSFIVSPFDLDTNFHVNNGRYLSIMDLGRFDMLIKPKVFWKLIFAGYYPVVVSESIRFKKSLGLFQRFSIKTEIESWDDKDFYIRQIFYHKNKIMAVGYIKGRFMKRGQKGSIPTPQIYSFLNYKLEDKKKSELSLAQENLENKLNDVIYGK